MILENSSKRKRELSYFWKYDPTLNNFKFGNYCLKIELLITPLNSISFFATCVILRKSPRHWRFHCSTFLDIEVLKKHRNNWLAHKLFNLIFL